MLCWMRPPDFWIQKLRIGPVGLTELIRLSIGVPPGHEQVQCNHGTGRCHASVFQHHHPTWKRPPRTPECAQVPLDVCGDNAHSPEDDQQRRGRPQKWQQPEKIPWEYDGSAYKRCCHWPG